MRPFVVACPIVALAAPGCAEQRHAVAHFCSPNTTDSEGKRFPRWVRYDDFHERHPYLTIAGCAALATVVVVGIFVAYVIVQEIESNEGHGTG
ncbi:MAG TPA: hypothetical protein VKE94_12065 [Gemmataceae bacterium]|nr:hypothetical protein [Gemmataceae bacterium]